MLKIFSPILILCFSCLPYFSHAENAPSHMVEVIDLKPGKTIDDVKVYFSRVLPVIKKYGATQKEMFSVVQRGDKTKLPKVALVWEFEDMSQLPQIFKDPNYTQHVAFRDSIFNLKDRLMFIGNAVE